MGIIAKRPIANAAWGAEKTPSSYASEYFRRYQVMVEKGALPEMPDHPIKVALGFVFAYEPVNTAIVGTRNPDHMEKNIQWLEAGLSLDPQYLAFLHSRFDAVGLDWPQQG